VNNVLLCINKLTYLRNHFIISIGLILTCAYVKILNKDVYVYEITGLLNKIVIQVLSVYTVEVFTVSNLK
jgi:hypothetical protein